MEEQVQPSEELRKIDTAIAAQEALRGVLLEDKLKR